MWGVSDPTSATRQEGVTLVRNQWVGTSGTRGQPVQALTTSCPDVQFEGGRGCGGGAHTLNLTGARMLLAGLLSVSRMSAFNLIS